MRANPDRWEERDTRTSWIVNRGYTGHEHLDAFKIINMNGRVYDPATGMFLSPDPVLQEGGNWLNYNRHSYCLNNPLKYTDPTGCSFFSAIWGGAKDAAKWVGKNWKTIVTVTATIAVAVVVGIVCAPAGVALAGALAGAASGLVGGVLGTALNGGNLRECYEAGMQGMIKGAIMGAIGGAFASAAPAGIIWGALYGAGAGAVTGGLGAAINGGDIGKGMLTGAICGAVGGALGGRTESL